MGRPEPSGFETSTAAPAETAEAQSRQTEIAGSRSITETLGAEAAAVEADRAAQQATAEALWQKVEELASVAAAMTATAQWTEAAVSGPEPTSEPDLSFPGLKVGDIVQFGRYEQDNDLENGPEPIEWRVLEIKDQAALLLSRSILDLKNYHYRDAATSWMNCTLRKWLMKILWKLRLCRLRRGGSLNLNIMKEVRINITERLKWFFL